MADGTCGRRATPRPEGDRQQMSDATRKTLATDDLAEELEPYDEDDDELGAEDEDEEKLNKQIAVTAAKLARLRGKSRSLETGQKIVLGGWLMAKIRENAKLRAYVLAQVRVDVTREADKKRLKPFLREMQKLPKPPKPEIPRPAASAPPAFERFEREPASESRPLPRRPPSDD